jgi:hypothetical protein
MSEQHLNLTIWQCPHIISFIQNIELKESDVGEIIEEPKPKPPKEIKPPKNSSLKKLEREEVETTSMIDPTIPVHILPLFGGSDVAICDDCYKVIQSEIIINILREHDNE